tara:strand:- start:479 stop:949 length:471 start_codon:yes stop_codon:yes gene_type:complete
MTSIHSMTGGNYWKASDLNGGEVPVNLNGFTVETVGRDGEKEQCCIAKVAESEKGVVVKAKDNVVALLQHFKTDQIEDWDASAKASPVPATLYTVETNMGPGLRIRINAGTPEPATPAVQANSLGIGQDNPLSMFTPAQLAAMSPEQIAAISGAAT